MEGLQQEPEELITSYDVVITLSLSNGGHLRSAILNFPKRQERAEIERKIKPIKEH